MIYLKFRLELVEGDPLGVLLCDFMDVSHQLIGDIGLMQKVMIVSNYTFTNIHIILCIVIITYLLIAITRSTVVQTTAVLSVGLPNWTFMRAG